MSRSSPVRAPRDLPMRPLRVGVSSCLLGAEVRFDGQHKRDGFLVDVLAPHVEWVSVCPELEVGMGVPRESVRLVRARGHEDGAGEDDVRMLAQRSGEDWTERMETWARKKTAKLADAGLVGYVLKSRSPSCGMERVKLYHDAHPTSQARLDGVGLFARSLRRALPSLPVEEEGRLNDPMLREAFIERVFAYARLQALWDTRWRAADVVAFHTAHKMSLLAHSPEGYRALGRLVAGVKAQVAGEERETFRAAYEELFMSTLARPATKARHTNVLQHMLGHLRGHVDAADREELRELIEDFRKGLTPLVVPVTLMNHHVRRHEVAYLQGQTYLEPHPKELMLRNRV